jgi:hypothetical protein
MLKKAAANVHYLPSLQREQAAPPEKNSLAQMQGAAATKG